MRLKNTLSGKLQKFNSIKRKTVGMYNCGPTVYNFAHVGNLRMYVFADTLRRTFEFLGYKVNQVINITDVGHLHDGDSPQIGKDKVEEMASKEHKTAEEIISFYTEAFLDDLKKLNIETKGTKFPKATEHIDEQVNLIQRLEEKGFTYKIKDGIYFDTSKFSGYGKLGQVNTKDLMEGARVEVNTEKRNLTDFALWKFSKPEDRRQQEWPSPWGVGFPGWHIECSAMSMKYLGETFDIHTGGIDHIPVHHNNEIAQSEAATHKPLANFWLHGAFVNVDSGKMAKSKDNFIKLSDLEKQGIHPMSYRYWLLTARYETPLVFSMDSVMASQKTLESILQRIVELKNKKLPLSISKKINTLKARKRIRKIIENNLDTPALIAYLHESLDKISLNKVDLGIVETFDKILGLNLISIANSMTEVPESIKKLSTERDAFRQAKNWQESDRIRRELENQGYFVKDAEQSSSIIKRLSVLIGGI